MKRSIYAMSKSKADIGAELDDGIPQLMMYMIKLYLYPSSESIPYWRKEVAEKLNATHKMKWKNRFPSKQFIIDNTWYMYQEYIPNYIEGVIDDYGPSEISVDIRDISYRIFHYLEQIAEILSKVGFISYEHIYRILEELNL